MTNQSPICLKGGLVLTSAEQPAAIMDVILKGDEILATGQNLDPASYGCKEVRDLSGHMLVPGFINTHYHSHDRWDRGRFSPMPLEIWMSLYNPPIYGRNWTPDEIYLRTLLGGIELMRGGTTAVQDDVHMGLQIDDASIDAVFRAYEDLGLRADVAICYADIPGHETIPYLNDILPDHLKSKGQIAARSQEEMLDVWQSLAERWNGRVRSVLSVSGPQRCSIKFQQEVCHLAARLDRPILTHVLETKIQAMSAHHFYGKPMIQHMHENGFLTPQTVLIHGVWMSTEEMELAAKHAAGVSHNPASNTKLGSGIAPVIDMMKQGIAVGLGTDNHNANDNCSMFEALKFGNLLHPLTTDNYSDWLSAADSIRMATEHGAVLMGLAGIVGKLEPGMKADFLVLDLNDDAFFPLNDPSVHMVFAHTGTALRDVYVAGEQVMANQTIKKVSEEDVRREIRDRIDVMHKKALGGIPAAHEMEPYLRKAYDLCLKDQKLAPYRNRFNCCSHHG